MTTTMITGADGHLGQAIARWLLANTDHELLLCVRRRDGATAAWRDDPRCRLVHADLSDAEPYAGIPARANYIVHCAALTNFTVDADTARRINVNGTHKLLRFAAHCRSLRRFAFASTLYAAGLRSGRLDEYAWPRAAGFANHYEASKWQGEQAVTSARELPWQVLRLATVVADDEHGSVVQHNAVHNTLRLLYYGLLSILPGDPATRIYTTTTGFAADAIGRLLTGGESQRHYHLSDAGEAALTLGELVDLVHAAFLRDPDFAQRRVLKPRFCDQASFLELVRSAERLGAPVAQSLHSVAPFSAQLFCDKHVVTERSTRSLGGRRSPCARRLLPRVAACLATSRWGYRSGNHSGVRAHAG